jgi:hypothetical protein
VGEGDVTRFLLLLLCVASLLLGPRASAQDKPFIFPVPEGFVRLEPNAAPPPMSVIDDSLFEQAKSAELFAVQVGPEGVEATFMAKVFPGIAPLSNLPEVAKKAVASSKLAASRILSTSVVDIAGVKSGRIELETRLNGATSRQLLYLLSGREHWATVTLAASDAEYDRASQRVTAALAQVQGLSTSSKAQLGGVVTQSDDTQGKLGALLVAGSLGGLLLNKLLRRRKLVQSR